MDLLYFTAGIATLVASALLIIKRIEARSYLHRRVNITEPNARNHAAKRESTAREKLEQRYVEWYLTGGSGERSMPDHKESERHLGAAFIRNEQHVEQASRIATA